MSKLAFGLPLLGWVIGAASLGWVLQSGLNWPLWQTEVAGWQWALNAATANGWAGFLASGSQPLVLQIVAAGVFLALGVGVAIRAAKTPAPGPMLALGHIEFMVLASCWGMWRELAIHPVAAVATMGLLGVWVLFSRIPVWLLGVLAAGAGVCTGTLPEGVALTALAAVGRYVGKQNAPSATVSWAVWVGSLGAVAAAIFFNYNSITITFGVGLSYGLGALGLLAIVLGVQTSPTQRLAAAGWALALAVGLWGQWLGVGGGFAVWLGVAGLGAWAARLAWDMPPVRSLVGILLLAAVLLNGLAVWSFRTEALLESPPELIDATKRGALLAAIPPGAGCIFAPDSTGAQFALYLHQPGGLCRPSVAALLSPDANGKLWIANAIRTGHTCLVVRTPALEGYDGLQPYLRRRLAQVGLFQVWELNPNEDGAPARGLASVGFLK